jgi:predicted transcriptional regulator of viral defense system
MSMSDLVAKLYQSGKTVFTNKDLALIWEETNPNNLKAKIAYYVKKGVLLHLTRGVFGIDENYDAKELATSIYTPSYISFETALREAGVIFQHYDTIFVAGPWTATKQIGQHTLVFRKLKSSVLYNPAGMDNADNYSIATPERAYLDMLYLFPKYHFDNLSSINWERCNELVKIYNNRQLIKRLDRYQAKHAQ